MRFLFALLLLGLAACQTTTAPVTPAPPSAIPSASLSPAQFSDLPGWQQDDLSGFSESFARTCGRLANAKPKWGGKAAWTNACAAIKNAAPAQLRATIERYLQPYAVTDANSGQSEGLFTGYYEPLLQGSRIQGGPYQTPLYALPNNLVTADLGLFRDSLKGQTLIGKVVDKKFVPYGSRADITGAPIDANVLAWVSDPIDAFFLEIQGSGYIQLTDGSLLHVGYAGKNGEAYTPIGRMLREQGDLPSGAGMAEIKDWLRQHPEKAREIMNSNQSYVFFRQIPGQDGPIGGAGVPLTPQRSLAVDTRVLPYGIPVFVSAKQIHLNYQRLMVAQDTGGAIKGAIRGDIFWGHGADAEQSSGGMQANGRYWVLLPKK